MDSVSAAGLVAVSEKRIYVLVFSFLFCFVGFAPTPWKKTSILSLHCNAKNMNYLHQSSLGGDGEIRVSQYVFALGTHFRIHQGKLGCGAWERGAETLHTCCQEPREGRTC